MEALYREALKIPKELNGNAAYSVGEFPGCHTRSIEKESNGKIIQTDHIDILEEERKLTTILHYNSNLLDNQTQSRLQIFSPIIKEK